MATTLKGEKLKKEFKKAADDVWKHRYSREFQDSKMQLYGLYKAATSGACSVPRPANVVGMGHQIQKWESWMQASTFSPDEAMKRYIELAYGVVKACTERSVAAGSSQPEQEEIERLNNRTRELERCLALIVAEREHILDHEDLENDCEGYLTKWRERDAFMLGGSTWEKLYFTLRGATLTMYGSEKDRRARGVVNIAGCNLRDEGTKPARRRGNSGQPVRSYHIFGLYLADSDTGRGPNAGVVMRLSCEDESDAQLWMEQLGRACLADDEDESTFSQTSPVYPSDGGFATAGIPASSAAAAAGAAAAAAAALGNSSAAAPPPPPPPPLVVMSPPPTLPRRRSTTLLSSTPAPPPPVKRQFSATAYPASKTMHKQAQPSLLSEASPEQNYRGFLNLLVLLVITNNIRNMIANFGRYGLLITLPGEVSASTVTEWPCFTGSVALVGHLVAAWAIERSVAPSPAAPHAGIISGGAAARLHALNLLVASLVPLYVVWNYTGSPLYGFGYLFTATILVMKLASYAHCNRDVRLAWLAAAASAKAKGEGHPASASTSVAAGLNKISSTSNSIAAGMNTIASSGSLAGAAAAANNMGPASADGPAHSHKSHTATAAVSYPANLTLQNAFWFWFSPTLCYQLEYPRNAKVDYRYAASLLVRVVLFGALIVVIVEQYMMPTVQESYGVMLQADWLSWAEKLLALSVPNTYVWLLGFYVFFHCWLNLLAEVLRFGDRIFYRAWWSAQNIEEYWRLWNLPVHYWLVRHFYFPLLRSGWSKAASQTACFVLSAVVHELLISVPFRMIRCYAFLGMVGNIPLVPLTKAAQRRFGPESQAGNYCFWIVFCILGQPMSVLLYYNDYCSQNVCTSLLLGPGAGK